MLLCDKPEVRDDDDDDDDDMLQAVEMQLVGL